MDATLLGVNNAFDGFVKGMAPRDSLEKVALEQLLFDHIYCSTTSGFLACPSGLGVWGHAALEGEEDEIGAATNAKLVEKI
jgi:hypothetical protein